jgi:hypothetical protein
MCGAAPMYTERNRTARANLTPQSSTDGTASCTGTTADGTFQRALQTSGRDRRHHIAGDLCLGDAADAISRDQEDPSAPHRDSHGHQSATWHRLVVGGATLENVHVTFRPISTNGLIRQQHLSRTYPKRIRSRRRRWPADCSDRDHKGRPLHSGRAESGLRRGDNGRTNPLDKRRGGDTILELVGAKIHGRGQDYSWSSSPCNEERGDGNASMLLSAPCGYIPRRRVVDTPSGYFIAGRGFFYT